MAQQIDQDESGRPTDNFADFEQDAADYFYQIEALDQATADITDILASAHDKATKQLSDTLQADNNERNNSN